MVPKYADQPLCRLARTSARAGDGLFLAQLVPVFKNWIVVADSAKRIGGDRASRYVTGSRRAPGGVLDGEVEVSYPMDVINACFRSAYRLAYPLAKRWWAWRGHNGTAIAVWVGDRVLVVRHSYKPGLRLPGGGVKAGEDHMLAAIRELQEETGLIVAAADMVQLMETYGKFGKRSIFEVQLDAEPELTVDQREIVYAGFAPVDSVIEYNPRLRSYLRARSSPPLAA
jgi:8-oxo-dGTP pyrophosphatase MutT (NUDIX family)